MNELNSIGHDKYLYRYNFGDISHPHQVYRYL